MAKRTLATVTSMVQGFWAPETGTMMEISVHSSDQCWSIRTNVATDALIAQLSATHRGAWIATVTADGPVVALTIQGALEALGTETSRDLRHGALRRAALSMAEDAVVFAREMVEEREDVLVAAEHLVEENRRLLAENARLQQRHAKTDDSVARRGHRVRARSDRPITTTVDEQSSKARRFAAPATPFVVVVQPPSSAANRVTNDRRSSLS